MATGIKAPTKNLGPRSTPQEVRELRKSAMDFHGSLGQPAIHKHRWNEEDVRKGLAKHCPFHDDVYGQDKYDPYCFGTGYLGGWSDGIVVNLTIADAPIDTIRFNEQGVLIRQSSPGLTAPWIPLMGDGDMIITAEFKSDGFTVLDTGQRYLLKEVTPVNIRGIGMRNREHLAPYRVSQSAQIDTLPFNNRYYEVPIIFDYGIVPDPQNPADWDPGDHPADAKLSQTEFSTRVVGGVPERVISRGQDTRITGISLGPESGTTHDVRIVGKTKDTHVYL